ncbi:uncharacterized protein LOC130770015 isoform X2 [Actinidia eriantha]|uniref:uncharacterized protein LOC130770015 isoform X2 n=1 Tax=Actinidia eriantha TaxID=165200 RepID=UPI0025845B62|nr:uncharacterized protein LOC130770015 isoform X2 [Actinidia eriantha]
MKCLICPCFCWHALNLSTANLFKRLFNTTLPGADTSMTEVTEMVPRLQWMEKQSFRLYLSKIPRSDSFVVCAPKGMKQCISATNRLITAKDHAVQINVGHSDANGIYTGLILVTEIRKKIMGLGDADSALDRLWQKKRAELRQ